MKKNLIIIILPAFIFLSFKAFKTSKKEIVRATQAETIKTHSPSPNNAKIENKDNSFATIVHEIKRREGFYALPYWDTNSWAIGYGTQISYSEVKEYWKKARINFLEGVYFSNSLKKGRYGWANKYQLQHSALTEKEASVLLYSELQRSKDYVEVLHKSNKLSQKQKLSIASLIYNVGVGNYKKTKLYAAIKSGAKNVEWLWSKTFDCSKNHTKSRNIESKIFHS